MPGNNPRLPLQSSHSFSELIPPNSFPQNNNFSNNMENDLYANNFGSYNGLIGEQ